MKYKLLLSKDFAKDINEIFDYIANELYNKIAAQRLMSDIDKSIKMLESFPFSCPQVGDSPRLSRYRKLLVKHFIVIYIVEPDSHTVNLLRCFGAQSDYLKQL